MKSPDEFLLDISRKQRIGLSEAVFCGGKSPGQIGAILDHAAHHDLRLLLTRLSPSRFGALPTMHQAGLDYDPVSETAYWGAVPPPQPRPDLVVVTAGTSDQPVAREVLRTLRFDGIVATGIADIGVAGLWRLNATLAPLQQARIIIVIAGMDAALPSVIGGLVSGLVIAVPSSVGYGVAAGGQTALNAVLASCAPGIVVVNIDNGYGAACAALRALGRTTERTEEGERIHEKATLP